MLNISDWIKYELYPALFESIDLAFPEHDFKRFSHGWRSKTYLNGSSHKSRIDKTVVTKKAPGYILEQGGDVLSLIDYVIKSNHVDFIDAVKILASVVNLEVPKSDFNNENYIKHKEHATIYEDCNSFYIYCLENFEEANDLNQYLVSRGYSPEDIKTMELGYFPGQTVVNKYLDKKGYSQTLIDEIIKNDTRLGTSHILTIPYRSGGTIKGFKFRSIKNETPKYLNSSGLDRMGGFFNLLGIKGDKDLVIVEGELDSLNATVKGIDNVVATGGSSISTIQIKDAVRRGAKSFTICFDTEPNKEIDIHKKINAAIDIILEEGVNRIYIAKLTDLGGDKTDPDRFINEVGVEGFNEIIRNALPYYEYKLDETLNKYIKLEEKNGLLTHKDKDNLLEDIVVIASNLDLIHKEQYIKAFISLEPIVKLGITAETLSLTVDRLTSTRDKELQLKEFKKLLLEANRLQENGEIDKALDLLDDKVNEVKLKDKVTEFSTLLLPIKEEDLKSRLRNRPESLKSGYTIDGDELLLPSGAITVLAAPTSHGKTSFLINLSLNVAQTYQNKEVYFISFEEDSDNILINALNTYLDTTISGNNRTSLKNYFAGANNKTIEGKQQFFNDLIETKRLNIHYTNYTSDTLIEAIRYLYKYANPGAIFIDYIQLLNLPNGKYKTYSRQEEIKQICIALKDIAVETGLPIILGAQFNREVVNQLKLHATKIGEAGDIERIAHLIIGFWNNNFKPLASEGEMNEINMKNCLPNTIYTTILKNRGGKVGQEEQLIFNGNTGKISNACNMSKQNNIESGILPK